MVNNGHRKMYFNAVKTEVAENNVPFSLAEAMMTEPLMPGGAEPEFEAKPRYLAHNSANNERSWLTAPTN